MCFVAPLVGAWIEILDKWHIITFCKVAPLVGAWIEIRSAMLSSIRLLSLLSWERGLKYHEYRDLGDGA